MHENTINNIPFILAHLNQEVAEVAFSSMVYLVQIKVEKKWV